MNPIRKGPLPFWTQARIIAGREIRLAFSGMWGIAYALLYTAGTVMAGYIYILIARSTRESVGVNLQGDSERDIAVQQGIIKFLGEFNLDPEVVNHILGIPGVVLFAYLLAVLLIPYFVASMSHGIIAAETSGRTLRLMLLRASRPAVFSGKLAAYAIITIGITIVADVVLLVVAALNWHGYGLDKTLLPSIRFWLFAAVGSLPFLALTTLVSCVIQRPNVVLSTCFGVFVGMSILSGWGEDIFGEAGKVFEYILPNEYRWSFFNPHIEVIAVAIAVCLVFAAAVANSAFLIFRKKDY
ncbi:MAG: hypothetical protein GMKNLPBB_03187 [Myxococcota bacterium]|nr:hypothetical protein [Myxococcota bacterium]